MNTAKYWLFFKVNFKYFRTQDLTSQFQKKKWGWRGGHTLTLPPRSLFSDPKCIYTPYTFFLDTPLFSCLRLASLVIKAFTCPKCQKKTQIHYYIFIEFFFSWNRLHVKLWMVPLQGEMLQEKRKVSVLNVLRLTER